MVKYPYVLHIIHIPLFLVATLIAVLTTSPRYHLTPALSGPMKHIKRIIAELRVVFWCLFGTFSDPPHRIHRDSRMATDVLIQIQTILILPKHIEFRCLHIWRNSQWVVCQPSAGVVVVTGFGLYCIFKEPESSISTLRSVNK